MTDTSAESKNGEKIPPKLDLRKEGVAKGQLGGAAAGIPSQSAGMTSKRETSRIPLSAVQPTATPATEAAAGPETAAAKRTTSRISLEAVLGQTEETKPAAGVPKTIRLKRPSEAPSLKIGAAAAKGAESAAAPGGTPPTVRKTVRVKRVAGPGAQQAAAVARPLEAEEAVTLAAPEEAGVVAPIAALLATFVTLVLIWVLCAQDFGPDISLTRLSTGKLRGMNLPWIGKIEQVR